ncbi:MAG: hypothetical protein KF784_13855 [Fimbriimonadaceae bacterium]|nr:hypothetical protein [Fimbriimonadaceae bacterium]
MKKLHITLSLLLAASALFGFSRQDPHNHGKTSAQKPQSAAELAFDQFKSMVGVWEGKDASTGRNIKIEYRLIANGSVVMATSDYDAHPNDQMVTMYSLDIGKLILTHYCVARNQPRLEATNISADGKTIEFRFKNGTGLKDINTGHMHNVNVWFLDKDTYKDQWSFYQNGKETFMEDFTLKRVK